MRFTDIVILAGVIVFFGSIGLYTLFTIVSNLEQAL